MMASDLNATSDFTNDGNSERYLLALMAIYDLTVI